MSNDTAIWLEENEIGHVEMTVKSVVKSKRILEYLKDYEDCRRPGDLWFYATTKADADQRERAQVYLQDEVYLREMIAATNMDEEDLRDLRHGYMMEVRLNIDHLMGMIGFDAYDKLEL